MKHKLTVLPLGGGTEDELTLGMLRAMREAPCLVLRTRQCGAARYLEQAGIAFETLDRFYESSDSFDELDEKSAAYIRELLAGKDVCLAVFDPLTDTLLPRLDVNEALPGVSAALSAAAAAGAGAETLIGSASALKAGAARKVRVITEIDSRLLAGECKLKLLDTYGPEHPMILFAQSGRKTEGLTLEDLDRQRDDVYGHLCRCVLPPVPLTEKTRFDTEDLAEVMRILRGEGGCPWDRQQTHESLRPYLIEEAYETASAIVEEDWEHVADELGDVLLQVFFHANIGEQYGTFSMGDITSAICRKMIARHRHIFGTDECPDAEAVIRNWDKIKSEEKHLKTATDRIRDIPALLPQLMRAEKVLKRCAAAGFDYAEGRDASELLEEALEQVKHAGKGNVGEDEIGRLLLNCVNLARQNQVECETALQKRVDTYAKQIEITEKA